MPSVTLTPYLYTINWAYLKWQISYTITRCCLVLNTGMDFYPVPSTKILLTAIRGGVRERREDSLNFVVPKEGPNLRFPLGEAIKAWNKLKIYYKSCFITKEFKFEIKDHLLTKYSNFACTRLVCHSCNAK